MDRSRLLFPAVLIGVVAVQVVATVRGGPTPALAAVRNPFTVFAMASLFGRYWIQNRHEATRRWVVYATPLIWIAALAIEHGRPQAMQLILFDTLFGIGVIGACGFVLAAVTAPTLEHRRNRLVQLGDALVLPLAASMTSYGLWETYGVNPVYDGRIYAFEEVLGPRFSLLGAQSYLALAPFSQLATACYATLGIAAAMVAILQPDAQRERKFLAAFVAAGVFGFVLYLICPAVGPLQAFQTFPHTLPVMGGDAPLLTIDRAVPRNGMPSLHTTWALLIWFNLGVLARPFRVAFGLFVALTMWAVIGMNGEHWFMDAVVAVPLATGLQLLFVSQTRSWAKALGCFALPAGWIATFRFATSFQPIPAVVAWLMIGATIGWPLVMLRGSSAGLAAACETPDEPAAATLQGAS